MIPLILILTLVSCTSHYTPLEDREMELIQKENDERKNGKGTKKTTRG